MANDWQTGEELDEAVAREVFGLSQEQIEAWPWGVPPFSDDRNFAAGVVSRLWAHEHVREALGRNLMTRLPHLYGGIAEVVLTASPDEICKAAIMAFGAREK